MLYNFIKKKLETRNKKIKLLKTKLEKSRKDYTLLSDQYAKVYKQTNIIIYLVKLKVNLYINNIYIFNKRL